jgi:hypothetical protein
MTDEQLARVVALRDWLQSPRPNPVAGTDLAADALAALLAEHERVQATLIQRNNELIARNNELLATRSALADAAREPQER